MTDFLTRSKSSALAAFLTLVLLSCTTPKTQTPALVPLSPEALATQDASELYAELFEQVQLAPVYPDSKTFVDMTPKEAPEKILQDFRKARPQTTSELKAFVEQRFSPPVEPAADYSPIPNQSIEKHIKELWKFLKREPTDETNPASSLIALPYSYIVPGGRFREIYYWDSYFTQLGLLADGEEAVFQDMVKNFSHLALTAGRIPNGNRDYYRGRSQPPFFSHMVALWQTRFGAASAAQFLPALKQEHDFWMSGADKLKVGEASARVVRLAEDAFLNRYWDDRAAPRPEAYKEDVALAQKATNLLKRQPTDVYRELRAGAESGWDYSTRWFGDVNEFATIQTTSLVPVDLNSLLYHLEQRLSLLYEASGQKEPAEKYKKLAENRLKLIQKYMWDEASGTFRDFNWKTNEASPVVTLAQTVPLFTGVATKPQAKRVAASLEKSFLKPGGLVTTMTVSGQQWDAPNGWPPHQWMAYAGLKRYGVDALAEKIRKRWLDLNRKVYKSTGKLMEKYNVIDVTLKSGGGEYPLQDGFGWTNGVFRAMSTPKDSLKHVTN